MKESLLSYIASNFISEYENVANSSVSYLLNKYSSAREALKKVLNVNDVPIYYTTELSTKNNGRPDITGRDMNGNKFVIIEGKFWANLTDNQPVNYLKELKDNGKLLFLVPNKRIESLKIDIKNRTNGNDDRIVIYSWIPFLSLIRAENNKINDVQLSSDLTQLEKLCQKMDKEGMPPLSMSSLDPMNGKLFYQFTDLIDECNSIIRRWKKSDFKGLKTVGSKNGYGFYFKVLEFGCRLEFSNYDWFSKNSNTPIWLYIQDKNWKKSEKIYHFLNNFDSENSYNDQDYSAYGIVLKPGMDKSQIIDHIVNKTKEILEFLNKNINND